MHDSNRVIYEFEIWLYFIGFAANFSTSTMSICGAAVIRPITKMARDSGAVITLQNGAQTIEMLKGRTKLETITDRHG